MGMVVQHNMNAINAYNKLNTNVAGLRKSSEKLSSGYRINRAGDDAAGLAVSEKMRSQIKGLNQAIRNSQDGINMVQTFEGAAQETHSILQRMKELAAQAANGTYQNEVDRDAIQLEFNQLNDELDQIADTDFNGTVLLNGGQMADGVKALNGKFDYTGNYRAATELGKGDVMLLGDYQMNDIVTSAASHATSDGNTGGNVTKANEAWAILNSVWTREPGKDGTEGPDSIDVTFRYDAAANTWTAIDATNGADKNQIVTEATENGGFKIGVEGCHGTTGTGVDAATGKLNDDELVNIVMDNTNLVSGDTITVTLYNPAKSQDAPTNGTSTVIAGGLGDGWNQGDDTKAVGFNRGSALSVDNLDITIDNTKVTDTEMTADLAKLIDKLNNATIEIKYSNEDATAKGDMSIDFGNGEIYTSDNKKYTMSVGNTSYTLEFSAAENKLDIKNATDTLFTIKGVAQEKHSKGNGSSGTVKYSIAIDTAFYKDDAMPTAEVSKTGAVSKSNAFSQASAPLTYTDHIVLQTGPRTKDGVDFTFEYASDGLGDLKANLNISSRADGLNTKNLSLANQEDANYAIDRIDNAINKASMVRATFGATQNRLEHKINNLTTTQENLTEAESSIRDTDMASEMMNYTKFNILQQAAQSMLAQANQQPQSILQLLG